jgi:hypothetical protein
LHGSLPPPIMQPMFANFVLASFMVGLTVSIHFVGLLALAAAPARTSSPALYFSTGFDDLRTLEHDWLERS